MRNSLMLLTAAAVVLVLSSFIPRPIEEEVVKVTAGQGSTLWNICERYYSNKEVRCFEEFVYDVKKENNLLNGRVLQAGQELTIVIKKQK